MLTVGVVEEILNEIVGPDQRDIDVQFPNVSVNTLHPERYENLSGQILDRLIEASGTAGPMTFGYANRGSIEPPEAGIREPLLPNPPGPTNAAAASEPTS